MDATLLGRRPGEVYKNLVVFLAFQMTLQMKKQTNKPTAGFQLKKLLFQTCPLDATVAVFDQMQPPRS